MLNFSAALPGILKIGLTVLLLLLLFLRSHCAAPDGLTDVRVFDMF